MAEKEEKSSRNEEKSFFKGYSKIVKKMYKPDGKTWWNTFWRVSLILIVTGIVLFVLDWLLLKGVLEIQAVLPEFSNHVLKVLYIVCVFLAALFTIVGVLAQRGDDSGGLTAMLGSNVQYGDTTGSYTKKISKTTYISTVLLLILCLFAPMFFNVGSAVS